MTSLQLTVSCPQCNKTLRVPASVAGKAVRCPGCQAVVKVPVLVQATPVPTQPVASAPISSPDPFASLSTLPQPGHYGTYHPPASVSVMPYPRRATSQRQSSGSGGGLRVFLIVLASFAGLAMLGGILIMAIGLMGSKRPSASLTPSSVAIPTFPDLGAPFTRFYDGSEAYFVSISGQSGPGGSMQFRVYLPAGTHAKASLPCVLVAPAGTNLLYGAALDTGDYHDEALPYAEAGMAVVCYSLDGDFPESEQADEAKYTLGLTRAYGQFMAAKAGVVNGRNALEFALQKLPQIDPQRIYCAGHSSAATLSLLLAAEEPRIAACVAYAPITNLETRLGEAARDAATRRLLPGLAGYLKTGSPLQHVDDYHCPLFIFHARDDSNEPFESTAAFVAKLQATSATVKLATVNRGDHYQSMIDQGIPQAIQWLKSKPETAK